MERRTDMRKWLATLAVSGLSLTATVLPAPYMATAHAVDGCTSKVVNKAMPWGQDFTYQYPARFPLIKTATIRLVTTVTYQYCPNGKRAAKIKPLIFTYCHLHITKNSFALFRGVKFEPYIADEIHDLPIPQWKVPDGEGGEQVCDDVSAPAFEWFRPEDSAAMSVTAMVDFKTYPDQEVTFKWYDSTVRYFKPLEDVNVSGWYE